MRGPVPYVLFPGTARAALEVVDRFGVRWLIGFEHDAADWAWARRGATRD
jgi:hypothetical protein